MNSHKKLDILVLGLMLVLGIVYGSLTKDLLIGRAIITFSVFTIPPIIYLSVRAKKDWLKIILSTAIFGILFALMIDFFEQYNSGWDTISLIFPKILGVDPIDNIIAYGEMTMLTIVFYQHFIDQEKRKISQKFYLPIFLSILIIAIELILFFYSPNLLKVDYAYFYMGMVALIAPVLLAFRKPSLIKNMLEVTVYFFILYFCIEIIALKENYWIFPGKYIGWVSVLGVGFPLEELLFWMGGYAASIVAYYEIFIKENDLLQN